MGESEMKKIEISVKIKDEDGKEIIETVSEKEVPYIEEFVSLGFRTAFHELETAVLESRKEVSDSIVSEYLEYISEKKREMSQAAKKSEVKISAASGGALRENESYFAAERRGIKPENE